MRGKIKILAPLAVLMCGAVVAAILAWPKGAPAEPGPPTPFEQETPKSPGRAPFSRIEPTMPLKDFPPMPSPFTTAENMPPEKSVEEMTPEELEIHRKVEALKSRPNPFRMKRPKVEEDEN